MNKSMKSQPANEWWDLKEKDEKENHSDLPHNVIPSWQRGLAPISITKGHYKALRHPAS